VEHVIEAKAEARPLDRICYRSIQVSRNLSKPSHTAVIEALLRLGGTARTRDILAEGVHPRDLYAARDAGEVIVLARGVYRLATLPLAEPDLVAVVTRMPRAILCLTTALHLHGLTLEIPRAVHVALPQGTHSAKLDYPPLEVYHFSPASFQAGVAAREIDGIEVRLTTPAKSVADAFKFRSRIGLEAAINSLKMALHSNSVTASEVDEMAAICGVRSVMRPYLEALA
jgi:predicted transcriptional regulator of viral defense system